VSLLLLLIPISSVPAQVAPEQLVPEAPIHTFENARDLAVDERGTVYVLDAETATVTVLVDQRFEQRALMGTGGRGDAFSSVVDLDPTNGLRLIVADAGRGELQWYSRSFRLLETRPVVRSAERQTRGLGYDDTGDGSDGSRGRPTAVVSTIGGELFAVDDSEGLIYKWDTSGRFEGTIGAEGEGRLIEPVDIAVSTDLLFAADSRVGSVMVYDRFGSFMRQIAAGRADRVHAITVHEDHLYITLPREIMVYSVRGRLLKRHPVELEEPLVDCVRKDDALYLLTQTELYQLPTER
jgi:hypothetical protein